jgi:hypothetical protein
MSRRHRERTWSSSERDVHGVEAGARDAAARGDERDRRDRGRDVADPGADEAAAAARSRSNEFNEWT